MSDLTALVQVAQSRFLFRDPDGRRIYGSVDEIQMPRQFVVGTLESWNGHWSYAFTLTEATDELLVV